MWQVTRKVLSLEECYVKGNNPKKPGNSCHNIQLDFCDQLKAYITGFLMSENTYTATGSAEMIKAIVAHITFAYGTGAGKT
jgi:hypothetical protein